MATDYARTAIAADTPVFLTNVCCEVVDHLTADDLRERGLDVGVENYPLTPAEERFIGDDFLAITDDIGIAVGYSAFWRNAKWLSPEIAIHFNTPTQPIGRDVDAAEVLARAVSAALEARLGAYGVSTYVTLEDERDRHTILLVVPMSLAQRQFDTYDTWTQWLSITVTRALHEATHGVPELIAGIPMPAPFDVALRAVEVEAEVGAEARYQVAVRVGGVDARDPAAAVRATLARLAEPDAGGLVFEVVGPNGGAVMVRLSADAEGGYECWTAAEAERLTA